MTTAIAITSKALHCSWWLKLRLVWGAFFPWEMHKGRTLDRGISLILDQQRGTMSAPPGVQSELDVLASKPLDCKI